MIGWDILLSAAVAAYVVGILYFFTSPSWKRRRRHREPNPTYSRSFWKRARMLEKLDDQLRRYNSPPGAP